MTAVVAVFAGLAGFALGPFLRLLIWHVPLGESVRCHDHRAHDPRRLPWEGFLLADLFVAMALRFDHDWVLPAYLYLAFVGLALGLIDAATRRLPDALTLPSYAVAPALLGAAALLGSDSGDWVRAVIGGAVMYAIYFALALISPGGMGFGDVKLAGVLGLYTAWISWQAWTIGLMDGFVLGALWSIGLLVSRKGGRKSKVPFGPFMLLGVLVAVLAGPELADAYLDLTVGS